MGMTIEDIKHCLKVMVDCEVCEECNLYGTTGTDHCEHDCVCGALDIINKYQKIEQAYKKYLNDMVTNIYADGKFIKALREVLEDGNNDCPLVELNEEVFTKKYVLSLLEHILVQIKCIPVQSENGFCYDGLGKVISRKEALEKVEYQIDVLNKRNRSIFERKKDNESATNGDMIKAMFPYALRSNYVVNNTITVYLNDDNKMVVSEDWWNSPYKGE